MFKTWNVFFVFILVSHVEYFRIGAPSKHSTVESSNVSVCIVVSTLKNVLPYMFDTVLNRPLKAGC